MNYEFFQLFDSENFQNLKAEGYLKVHKGYPENLWLFRVWGNHYVPLN